MLLYDHAPGTNKMSSRLQRAACFQTSSEVEVSLIFLKAKDWNTAWHWTNNSKPISAI